MSSLLSRAYALTFALATLTASCSARVLWFPEDFDPHESSLLFSRRSVAACGGIRSLDSCPSDFPPNFCCPSQTTCLSINTGNSSVTSAICCPAGQDCSRINTISCQQDLQDADSYPGSQLHSIPPQKLEACGSDCCPAGFTCKNGICVAKAPLSTRIAATPALSTSAAHSTPTKSPSPVPATADSHPPNGIAQSSTTTSFNGKSFAAGFLPGIALGIIIAALLVLLFLSRKRRQSDASHEKHRDTLTDLSTLRPTAHGRSISEPTFDAASVTRTDFLRSSPARSASSNVSTNNVTAFTPPAPKTPANPTPKARALFSRSPFLNQTASTPQPTQSPMPVHLKRGTLSFHISPIRALRKQKSTHSLRRQMTESSRSGRAVQRDASTETVRVLMPRDNPETPDQRMNPHNPSSAGTWETHGSGSFPPTASSRYPNNTAPLRLGPRPPPPAHSTSGAMAFLDSPYTPTKSQTNDRGLIVPGNTPDMRRETTFSTLMEKAGLRKTDLMMGSKKKADASFGI